MVDHPNDPTRRTTLKWMATLMATPAGLAACGGEPETVAPPVANLGQALSVEGGGYGDTVNILNPVIPWRRTMTQAQLRVTAALADAIIPAEGSFPPASEVLVPDFIDEWVSAPYPEQQNDRKIILPGLLWLQQESLDRFGNGFSSISLENQSAILDEIAWRASVAPGRQKEAAFFGRFRFLTVSAYYLSDAGTEDIGYMGNTPMAGPYPGPTDEALEHLRGVLKSLDLSAEI